MISQQSITSRIIGRKLHSIGAQVVAANSHCKARVYEVRYAGYYLKLWVFRSGRVLLELVQFGRDTPCARNLSEVFAMLKKLAASNNNGGN